MILQIRKKSTSSWEHIKGGQNIILSNGSFRLQNENFELTEISGVDQFDQPTTPLAEITLYDDTAAGLPETFTNTTDFVDRLRELGYPFFNAASGGSGAVEQIVAGTNITLDPPDGLGIVQINSTGGGSGGVTSIIAGAGISIDQSTGDVTITNTGGGANLEKDVNQVGHGFVAGNVIRLDGSTYVLAQADAVANANAISFVTEVVDVDNFKVQSESYISVNLGLSNGDEAFLSTTVAGGIQTTEPSNGEVNVYLGQQTPQGFLISISTGFVVGSSGSASDITEITDNIITFTTLKSWVNSKLSQLTIDKTNAIEGARTVTKFNSETDPNFGDSLSGIDFIGGNWVANTDLLLRFDYFASEVHLLITELIPNVPPILPTNYEMFLDGSDLTSFTIDGSNTVSEWRDQSANDNDFTAPSVAAQPFLKRVGGLLFDDSDDRLDLDKNSASYTGNTQGEVILVCAQRDQDNLTPVFALLDDANSENHIYFGYQGSAGAVKGAMCYNNQKGAGGSGNRDQVIENQSYEKYQNLKYVIWNIVSNGSTITMFKNGDAIAVQTVAGSNNGVWFGDKTITNGKFSLAALNTLQRDPEVASIVVYDTPLSSEDRASAVRNLKSRFFGMDNPLNLDDQTLTPTYEYINTLYNWTGGQSKNPVNGNIASVWDRGTTHYQVGDNHDVVGHLSTDNGLTYGSIFTVVAGSGNFSYTNPSIGYGSDGRLHCIYTKVEFVASVYTPQGLFFKYSDDDGATWSTEAQVTGVPSAPNMNSNSHIIQGNDGNLYSTSYDADFSTTNPANVRFLTSTDNGLTWGIKSNIITEPSASAEPVNETSLSLLADNTWLCMTRVQSRNYYTQSISIDNGVTWTDQGNTNLCDWWTDETTGTSSGSVNLIRTATFEVEGVKCVAYIYLNRGVNFNTNNATYYRIGLARAQDLIDYGTKGWQGECSINMLVSGINLDDVDGYGDIMFFDNDNTAYIRGFYDTSPVKWTDNPAAIVTTNVQYFKYPINENWVKAILRIT